jgi:hypothetical protein
VLLGLALLNWALLQFGSWQVELMRTSRIALPPGHPMAAQSLSVRGRGVYGEEDYIILAWNWGVYRVAQPTPRLGNALFPIDASRGPSLLLSTEPPASKWQFHFSRGEALRREAAMGNGFNHLGIVAAAAPKAPLTAPYRNIGVAIRGWWLVLLALIPFGRAALPWARSYRTDHRRASGRCPTCGYDLRATPERCPECGRGTDGATGA